jgi:DNA-directed RNA polymerase specialized sigma24 family protein
MPRSRHSPDSTEVERALHSIRDCRERQAEHEAAMWLNAAYAYRRGASIGELATAAGVSSDTVRVRLRAVDGDA